MEKCHYNIIITTQLDKEKIAEAIIEELLPEAKIKTMPGGYKGLILLHHPDPEKAIEVILKENPFVEKAFEIKTCSEAKIDDIAEQAIKSIKDILDEKTSFAVRTIRRGKHDFTSIDVNISVGSKIQEKTRSPVDLENPDYIVLINIINNEAYISVFNGKMLLRKSSPEKKPLHNYFKNIILAQEPYTGPSDATRKLGERIGRAIQTYELGEYIISLTEPTDALSIKNFIQGLINGIESRHEIQLKSYGRKPYKTKIRIYDMHNLIRLYHEHPIIIVEPEGKPVNKVKDELKKLLQAEKKPVFIMGSRKGVPTGLYRYADLIIDIAPGITLATEIAVTSLLSIIGYVLEEEEK